MKRLFTLLLSLFVVGNSASQPSHPSIRVVAIQDNRLCIQLEDRSIDCDASDKSIKTLPTWSKDGLRIAYFSPDISDRRLGQLVLVDQHRSVVTQIPVKPMAPGFVHSGMRYVETVEWLDGNLIAVSGTINPSSTEYNILDISTGKTILEFVDDGFGAAFSQDGKLYASVSGGPHFTPAKSRELKLNVNGAAIVDLSGTAWMPSGQPLILTPS